MDAILIEASASENFKYKLAIGLAWPGMAWRGVAWHGVAWRGMAWLKNPGDPTVFAVCGIDENRH
jgi:hypothetical protein